MNDGSKKLKVIQVSDIKVIPRHPHRTPADIKIMVLKNQTFGSSVARRVFQISGQLDCDVALYKSG